ncbi:Dihydrolipoamide acetyltransferase, long form protein [Trifolium repens]|nr:Dihydrolipoamide acetyltransferase, long form protein [Trifolium repens]
MASHLLNHSKKLRNGSSLLNHDRALLIRWFCSDVQPSSINRNRDVWKTQLQDCESSARNRVSESTPNFTKSSFEISQNSRVLSRRGYASASDLPPHQEIGMSSLSPTMTEGNIARWLKKEGDKVSPGEVLCEVETDKATVEMECMEEDYLAKIVRKEGEKEIKVGEVIAVTVEDEEDIAKLKITNLQHLNLASKPSAPPSSGDRIFASPLARKLAEEKNVDLSSIKGPGHDGLIVKGDIDDYLGIILFFYMYACIVYIVYSCLSCLF